MYIDNLRKYRKNSYYATKDIAEKLVLLSNLTDDKSISQIVEDVDNALFSLETIAQNNYNSDFYRTFYNVLLTVTGFESF